MCSMSLTVVVIARSTMVVMRSCISVGESPPYVQMTLTTGILMPGKISVCIVTIDTIPMTAIRSATTTNV